ncbi:MAG: type II toxin-antitoxin system VapC family toxin [Armatimonadetes bacterium]|nr:type II toxin-antitoxin system VapC family toxin [Armatimonadota bacterium]
MATPPAPYLLDTNILLAYVRYGLLGRYIEATYHLYTLQPSPIISIVTEGEIRAPALKFGWGSAKVAALQRLLNALTVVPLPFRNAIDAYATIDAHCEKNGLVLSKNDLWIAATAYATGAGVLTTDHDFDPLDGLFLQRD